MYFHSELYDHHLEKCGTELFVESREMLAFSEISAISTPPQAREPLEEPREILAFSEISAIHLRPQAREMGTTSPPLAFKHWDQNINSLSQRHLGLSAIHVTADYKPADSKQNLGYLGLKENMPETQTLWGRCAGCTTTNDTENMLVDVAQIGPTSSKQTRLCLRSTISPEDETHHRCQDPAATLMEDKMYDQSNTSATDASCSMALPPVIFREATWSSPSLSKRVTTSNPAAMDIVLKNQPYESLATAAHTHTVLGSSAQAPIVIDGSNDEQEEESLWNPERTECLLPSGRVWKRTKLAEGVRRWTDPQLKELQIIKSALEYYVVDDEDDDDYRPVKRRRT
jgi:hypothetical protein